LQLSLHSHRLGLPRNPAKARSRQGLRIQKKAVKKILNNIPHIIALALLNTIHARQRIYLAVR